MTKTVEVPETTRDSSVRIHVTICGVTPLLCNAFTDEAAGKATAGNSAAIDGGSDKTPHEIAETKLYLTEEGKPGIPQPNLYRCLIDAGKFFKAGKSKITTQKNSIIPSCVQIDGTVLPLEFSDDWSVDTRPIRNPATGGRRLTYRPCFHEWSLSFVMTVDTSVLSTKLVRELWDKAGKAIGLGDYRPDCKGPFGKFVVTLWREDR